MKRYRGLLMLLGLFLLAGQSALFAASLQFRWKPNPEPDLQGYRLYYGTRSRVYGPPIPVGRNSDFIVSGLEEGTVYYFAISAVDNSGNESGFSREIVHTVPSIDTGLPAITIGARTPTARRGSSVPLAGTAISDSGFFTEGDAAPATATDPTVRAEGADTIAVEAGDSAGSTAQATLTVTYAPAEGAGPGVVVTEPAIDDPGLNKAIDNFDKADDDSAADRTTRSTVNESGGTVPHTINGSSPGMDPAEAETTITVAATDQAGMASVDPPKTSSIAGDKTAPSVRITSPTLGHRYFWRKSMVAITGTARDDAGIEKITWRNSRGQSGTCRGTANWAAANIPLKRWWNTITVTAIDRAGNTTHQKFTVLRWK
jgi:hypothetical protein